MSADDRIVLRGLRVFGHHGVLAEEKRDGQEFGLDVELELDTEPAARSDDLADTVDYGALAQGLAAVVAGEPLDLIETLAQRLADRCLAEPLVQAVTVVVHKPSAPIPTAPVALRFDDVELRIRRVRPAP